MNRMLASLIVMMAASGWATMGGAQPPDGDVEPPPRREGPPPERRPPPPDRLREALDANHDHEVDEEEIKNAAAAVASLDEDGDGRVDERELMPPPPPRGFEGRPPRDRRGPGGPPPYEAGDRGPRERPGFRPPEPGDRPSPQRFVERAMSFDADGDGKLDRAELEKWAGEMFRMRGDPEAGRRWPPRRPDGEGDERDRPRPPRRPPPPPFTDEPSPAE